jgi:signal transduction histidine kinase
VNNLEKRKITFFIIEITPMKRQLLILIIFFLTISSFCQKQGPAKIDSLFSVLKTTTQDTTRVNVLNMIADEFRSNDPDTAIYFSNKALALATRTNYKMGVAGAYLSQGAAKIYLGEYEEAFKNNTEALKICNELLHKEEYNDTTQILKLKARAYNNIGNIYDNQGNYPEALKNHFAALKIREKTADKLGIAASYSNIGNIYVDHGNYTEGLKYQFASLKIKEEIGDKKSIANSFNNIGNTYYSQSDYSQALKYHTAALKIRREIGDKTGMATCYLNIGIIYDDKGNYLEALKYHVAALKIEEETGDQPSMALSYDNLGLIFMHRKDYVKALEYFFLYLKTSEEIGDKSGIADACITIGNVYIEQKKNNDASLYLNKGLLLSREVGNPGLIKAAYESIAKLDSAGGHFEQALQHYKLYIVYRDSLFNEENTKKLVQSQMQYEFDKKESLAKAVQEKKDAEAKRIKHQQYFTIATLGIIVLGVAIIALMQYRSNREKQKANALLLQQKGKVESNLQELKSTQTQLIQSEKMASLGELTAGVAHEIQNPLNFVNNFSEVSHELADEMKTELATGNQKQATDIADAIKQNLQKVIHHGKRADAIVKNMLQHARQTKGTKELTDINALCDEYLRLSYHGMRAKDKTFNAEIKTDFDNSIEKINIIPQDIGRVLLNIYNNAFYAVNEQHKNLSGLHDLTGLKQYQPTVSVQTKKKNNNIEIVVKDNGNGIPQNIIDKIFQPFFTTKPTGEGTGLGLSLAYDIVKAHGGEIRVDTKDHEETTFTISLPCSA